MNTKMKMRMLSLLLCFVMLVGLMPTTVLAQGTKLETPQNLKLQGTVLSWDAVDNADYYSVHLYHPNYQYNIGIWKTDGTSFNLYKYLKDGETYGATVHACSNGSYQTSDPAEIPLTACTNAGVPIYNYVNVVNGTSSNATAYPGMSVRLEAKPAPEGMVFDRWELSGGYINIGYSDTDTVIYVQAICDNDISARATYKYQENVTSAFTVQPQGGAALVGESFDVTYAMNFTPQGTVKVQVERNTPGDFTDFKQGTIDSASVQEDSVVTKTFRIMASDGTRNIYSDEFVVSWEDGPRFISQPVGGTVDHNVDFVATYALNFTPFSCRVERYNDYLGQWGELSFASATQATISSYDFNTTSKYRIKAIIQGGGEVYSDEFTVTWSDAVSKFIQHPVGGTVGLDEDFSFTFAINFTPVSNVAIQKYNSGFDSWDTVSYCTSLTSGTISGFASETTNKYRLEAYENGTPIHSNEFTVTWAGTNYTVSFAANGGSGTMADVNNVSGEYTLPACGFTAPNGQRFKAWLVSGNQKAVGDKITVSANTVVTAVWENIPEYMVSYNANGGSGTMVGDMVTENDTFTLETCTYIAPEGYKFKVWAIGSVNDEQKQPGDQITINAETYIYAIWEAVEYNVTVTGGTASVGAGTPITKATMGTTVTLTANQAPAGQEFDKWIVNGVVVADANSATTTFVMPACNVTAEATYKDAPHSHTPSSNWYIDETYHWKECTTTGCGVIIESSKQEHRPDRSEPTYDDAVKCAICGYVITPALSNPTVTLTVPFTKTVKLGDNVAPGAKTFTLEVFEIGNSNESEYPDVTVTATVSTNGEGVYDGTFTISGPERQIAAFVSEGFFVREKNDNAANWTYSDAVWYVAYEQVNNSGDTTPGTIPSDPEYALVPYAATVDDSGAGSYVPASTASEKMTFENTYTENQTDTEPTNPSESNPTDPTNPSESNPTDPTNPSESDLTNPTNPSESNPTDPTNPSESNPTDPTNPSESNPTDPTNPSESNPTDPTNPSESDPTDPTNPSESNATDPTNPSESTTDSKKPEGQGEQTEPTNPSKSNPDTVTSDSPQTGDNSNMPLWIILFFISGIGVVTTITLYIRRKKSVNKG